MPQRKSTRRTSGLRNQVHRQDSHSESEQTGSPEASVIVQEASNSVRESPEDVRDPHSRSRYTAAQKGKQPADATQMLDQNHELVAKAQSHEDVDAMMAEGSMHDGAGNDDEVRHGASFGQALAGNPDHEDQWKTMLPLPNLNYENTNLDEITLRQLMEDIDAYSHDLAYCQERFQDPDLSGAELRTMQLRALDLNHHMRSHRHRIEVLRIQLTHMGRPPQIPIAYLTNTAVTNIQRQHQAFGGGVGGNGRRPPGRPPKNGAAANSGLVIRQRVASGATTTPHPTKRPLTAAYSAAEGETGSRITPPKRPKIEVVTAGSSKQVEEAEKNTSPVVAGPSSAITVGDETEVEGEAEGDDASVVLESVAPDTTSGQGIKTLQRLGFWQCRLCTSAKYTRAGAGRVPVAPCKWPLKDIAKMITHCIEMHQEHNVVERCQELGDALDMNRGPFEYWIRRTRGQKIVAEDIVDCIDNLKNGYLPDFLRRLSRAAGAA